MNSGDANTPPRIGEPAVSERGEGHTPGPHDSLLSRLATVEMERDELRRRLESAERHRLQMTGLQIQHIWDFIDKDLETEVLVFYAEERKDIETGELMPAGLYVSLVDYPDEGCMYLPQDAEAALALLSPSSEAGKGDV